MSDPIPVVVCGKQAVIATSVKTSLQPEYEGAAVTAYTVPNLLQLTSTVIHVALTPSVGASEIPVLLQGGTPSPIDTENVGTKNYSKPPAAVIIGAGYDDTDFAELREGCKGKSNVPWLRIDMSKPMPPPGPGYGEAIVERVKVCLRGLAEEGKMEGDAIYWY